MCMCASVPHCHYQFMADGQVGGFNLSVNRLPRNVGVHTNLEQGIESLELQTPRSKRAE